MTGVQTCALPISVAAPMEPVAPPPTNIDLNELTELERQFEQLEEDADQDTDKQ